MADAQSIPSSSSARKPRSSSEAPITCVQPDHWYPTNLSKPFIPEPGQLYDPEQDPYCTRGIPVFKPTIEEFQDFETYMERVDVWGRKSGIVKIIPPPDWTNSLPSTVPLLPGVRLRNPIEQRMDGGSGLFRQQNIEKRKNMSVYDWAKLCDKDSLKTPSPNQTARSARSKRVNPSESIEAQSPPPTVTTNLDPESLSPEEHKFYSTLDPHKAWLPPNTKPEDYTPEACRNLERTFWRTCGISSPAWYGADMAGSLFTDDTKTFNVAKLPSFLSRLAINNALPGVNTPYLYFGMWRATFAWHVEDMDLYSINYIHWGAPKFWYSVPNERSKNFESVMRSHFPSDTSQCPEFLRHKSYLASPNVLAQSSVRPNVLVQHQGEFVITFPRGYHAGFNLGFNCAESVNFALESWAELGRKAGVCQCVPDSVRIDVDALLAQRDTPEEEMLPLNPTNPTKKRKSLDETQPHAQVPLPPPKRKKPKPSTSTSQASSSSGITIKLNKRYADGPMPCCLCASSSEERDKTLLECVAGPPAQSGTTPPGSKWMAHELCARVIPETWVDELDGRMVVYGVDCIVKDRWNLKCVTCVRLAQRKHGAKIQCTRGKCSKAYHVSCAIDTAETKFEVVEEVETDVIVLAPSPADTSSTDHTTSHGHLAASASPSSSGGSTLVDIEGDTPDERHKSSKAVKKLLVNVLCSQHNPDVQELRKQQKLDKMRADLMAMAPLARIRVRVSAGVFEVTLLNVDYQNACVTVLWGDGERRELRWGSIIWQPTVNPSTPHPEPPASQPSLPPPPITHYQPRLPVGPLPTASSWPTYPTLPSSMPQSPSAAYPTYPYHAPPPNHYGHPPPPTAYAYTPTYGYSWHNPTYGPQVYDTHRAAAAPPPAPYAYAGYSMAPSYSAAPYAATYQPPPPGTVAYGHPPSSATTPAHVPAGSPTPAASS